MAWTVYFTRTSRRDIDEKEAFLSRLGSATVARWRSKLVHAVARLEYDPLCYPLIEEAVDLGVEFRETLFGKRRHVYRLIYSVDEARQIVHIHHVRHAAQDRLKPDEDATA